MPNLYAITIQFIGISQLLPYCLIFGVVSFVFILTAIRYDYMKLTVGFSFFLTCCVVMGILSTMDYLNHQDILKASKQEGTQFTVTIKSKDMTNGVDADIRVFNKNTLFEGTNKFHFEFGSEGIFIKEYPKLQKAVEEAIDEKFSGVK